MIRMEEACVKRVIITAGFREQSSAVRSIPFWKKGEDTSGSLSKSPKWTGRVTASSLNVRQWAGTEYPKLKSCPQLSRGKTVEVCDTVKAEDGEDWYYVRIDGRIYGFVCGKYIEKV